MARISEIGGGETDDGAGARILAAVRSALIGRADLARRPRYTTDEWAALTREEKKACSDIGIVAVRQVPKDVYDQIDKLGRLRYEPAVPSLTEVWEYCPSHMAMVKAGHALMAIGTPEARVALRAGIDDHEYIAQVLAVRTMFTDEGDPWDNMSRLFTEARLATASGTSAAWRVLACFCDSGRGPECDLVSTDRRWLDLCISLRDHDSLAPAAREALRLADPAVTRPALDAARQAREEQARRAPALVAWSLLRRYQRGEHRAVWRELADVGPLNDAWRAEAAQVAAATMERVRDNAERLAAAMIAHGWPVPPGTAVPGPDPEAGQYMEQLEQALGMPVPPALSAFWHVVGEIELVPDYSVHKSLPDGVPGVLWGMDPLEIHGCVCIDIGLDEWRDQQEGAHPEAALLDLWVSRDGALKMGASGSTNAISLPFAGADPVVHDGLGLRFTDYLRRAFENKGFLDDCRTMYGTDEEKSAAVQWLASVEFEPIEF